MRANIRMAFSRHCKQWCLVKKTSIEVAFHIEQLWRIANLWTRNELALCCAHAHYRWDTVVCYKWIMASTLTDPRSKLPWIKQLHFSWFLSFPGSMHVDFYDTFFQIKIVAPQKIETIQSVSWADSLAESSKAFSRLRQHAVFASFNISTNPWIFDLIPGWLVGMPPVARLGRWVRFHSPNYIHI